mgnify:CR=1 FL=1
MAHYIRTYPNFFDEELCDAYVQTFEETMAKDAKEVEDTSICTGPVRPDGHKICGTCNCQRMNPMGFDRFDHLNTLALSKFQGCLDTYKKDVDLHVKAWPKEFGWEEFRMKRFLCDTDEQFQDHVDVKSREGAKRFLIMMVYLNDDFDEGETQFSVLGDKIKPEKGKLLMFPPHWQYLHRGNPPKNGYAKYFLMTYLNYVEPYNV